MSDEHIVIKGAWQNNLKGIDLCLPLNKLIVITGVSGSGKSSLAFDTIYSEGQRRYVETFSPYTRQFLERMDRPRVERIEGIPPAIAIDQTNPVRTSRSTVGTMTELNDHIKLIFARAAHLYCRGCGRPVRRDTPGSILEVMKGGGHMGEFHPLSPDSRILITFTVPVPRGSSIEEVMELLKKEGYRRFLTVTEDSVEVTQDRVLLAAKNYSRILEDIEASFAYGRGKIAVYPLDEQMNTLSPLRFSSDLHCPHCDIHYRDPIPNLFSFNSPIGACETCRGFGRIIGIDYNLVVPDERKNLSQGAIKPWQTTSYSECQEDLIDFAKRRGIPIDVPWDHLSEMQRQWVIQGEGRWEDGKWYGVKRFFDWLETKSYRMHIRVLLSKYRTYQTCPSCGGARLKPEALLWRLGTAEKGSAGQGSAGQGSAGQSSAGQSSAGQSSAGQRPGEELNIHEIMLLSIDRCGEFFQKLKLPRPLDEATVVLLREIRTRLRYLIDVGLGYLTLDRQSRTLSGGEVQRINLTTALGTSLVNTLFVLDEPSIGLHSRDIRRLIHILHRLRDAGNTLVVVEHDPEVIHAADLLVDMGPGPGERGGEVVFFGSLPELLDEPRSLTAQYLSGQKKVSQQRHRPIESQEETAGHEEAASLQVDNFIAVLGASEHNLKSIDVRFPLGKLVCVTGVSGSGKSTLLQDVLYNALRKLKNRPVESPGRHREVIGYELIDDVILVDQSPIGKTTRSNPLSYVGAFDPIRKLFSSIPLAQERGYTAGTFSFNSGRGRCPTCGGSGFEHIEMQFLSDVYLRCQDCDGKRYRQDVLDVKLLPPRRVMQEDLSDLRLPDTSPPDTSPPDTHSLKGARSIAEVLTMTVSEACDFFRDEPEVIRLLEPLREVGLGYVTLGQPVPTLSGGEAQRLKLAGHLAQARRKSGRTQHFLFLFDEPTTGLHFDDITTLLAALRKLIDVGHSVVVIEHNLDVIHSADWIIDLGPEGGEEGGWVLCEGTPEEVVKNQKSYTGKALKRYKMKRPRTTTFPSAAEPQADSLSARSIHIRHAREHNLKNIDVNIPLGVFTVITGVSGSGKSTLAFDILFSEGQRRYLESLNAYARQFVQPASRPDVDGVNGVPPTVAIQQRTSRGGRKSTVATMTEIYHFLRLLFVKLGIQHCPECGIPIVPQTREAIISKILSKYRGGHVGIFAPLITARKGYYTDLAKWASGRGYRNLRVDGVLVPTSKWPRLDRFREHTIELPVGETKVSPGTEDKLRRFLDLALDAGKGVVHLASASREGKETGFRGTEEIFSIIRSCPSCGRSFEELDPRLFSFNSKHGWCPRCYGTGLELEGFDGSQTGEEIWWNEWWEGSERVCRECSGFRLRPEALAVRFKNRTIVDFTKHSVEEADRLFGKMKLKEREAQIARDVVEEIRTRLTFLKQVGLPYLTLDRAAPTLSGGEAQRIRLASQLGSNLRGVCYILDEPTIGLHARDNRLLLDTLQELKAKGNTVVVVEHDEETIRQAEHVVDLGPGGGVDGGRLVYEGTVSDLLKNRGSMTGRLLAEPLRHPIIRTGRTKGTIHTGKDEETRRFERIERFDRIGKINQSEDSERFGSSRKTGRDGRLSSKGAGTADGNGHIEIKGARLHNLKGLNVRFPLERLVCVSGVSGSGKSTLVQEVLFENLHRLLQKRKKRTYGKDPVLIGCSGMSGWERVQRVLEVNQTPIGKTPRSCPATYVGFWDEVRRLFARLPEAMMRGYGSSRFSFNVAGGRCEVCAGQGIKKIAMSFLPDVSVVCEACDGKRFNQETLAVCFKGRSISDVLSMSVDEAVDFFAFHPSIHHPLRLLQDVGLGYLTLGQQSPTLSGGEAQRIKLVTELAKTRWLNGPVLKTARGEVATPLSKRDSPLQGDGNEDTVIAGGEKDSKPARAGTGSRYIHTLYVLDEPTIGLHMADVEKLIRVLHRLVNAGNTVVIIEHNLDMIAEADWIIDLGPEGGSRGGRIVAKGSPEIVARTQNGSYTAEILHHFLKERTSHR